MDFGRARVRSFSRATLSFSERVYPFLRRARDSIIARPRGVLSFSALALLRLGDGGVGIAAVGGFISSARGFFAAARLAGLGGGLAGLVRLVEIERAALVAAHPERAGLTVGAGLILDGQLVVALGAGAFGFAGEGQAAGGQTELLFEGGEGGFEEGVVLGSALVAGGLRRAGAVGERHATLIYEGIVVRDEVSQFGERGLQIVERIEAAGDGLQGFVGGGAQGLDVVGAGGDGGREARAVALVEGFVGLLQALEVGRGGDLGQMGGHGGRLEVGEQVFDHAALLVVLRLDHFRVAREHFADALCGGLRGAVVVLQVQFGEQLQGSISLVARAVQLLQFLRSLLLPRQIERLVFLLDGLFEGFEHGVHEFDVGFVAERRHVAGELEVLHVLERALVNFFNFHKGNVVKWLVFYKTMGDKCHPCHF